MYDRERYFDSLRWRFAEAPDCTDSAYHRTQSGRCLDCGLDQTALLHYWWRLLWLLHGEGAGWSR